MHAPIRYTFYRRAHQEQEGPKERAGNNFLIFRRRVFGAGLQTVSTPRLSA